MRTMPMKKPRLGALSYKILCAGLPAVILVMAYILHYICTLTPSAATIELPRVALMLEHALMSLAAVVGGALVAHLAQRS